jgi:hypothetical protein
MDSQRIKLKRRIVINKLDTILLSLAEGLLPEELSQDDIFELITEYGKYWFYILGYNEIHYRKPVYMLPFSILLGKTISKIETTETKIIFITSENEQFHLYHDQQCCEEVYVEDIIGELTDLLESPILMAEEITNKKPDYNGTWTFYKLATIKGYVTIRWYGHNNGGCYSEKVCFAEL